MGHLNFSKISEPTASRLLKFLNSLFRPQDIQLKDLVKSNTDDKKDYGIGPVVAKRIISRRKELPGWRFTELSQLNGIKGFGQDKLEDLVDTFSLSSAEHFSYVIRERQILYENFPLHFHAITFEDEETFRQHTKDDKSLRGIVAEHIAHLASKEKLSDETIEKAQQQIKTAYIEKLNSAFLAAYAWAVWFYKFDADNWFAFDTIRIPIESYLPDEDPALYLFKGFDNGLLFQGIIVEDLPVVVNSLERTIYLWGAELFD